MKVLVAHPGTQYSHQLVKQLYKQGLLYKFYTSIAIAEKSLIKKLIAFLPGSFQKKISNRIIGGGITANKICNIFLPEIKAIKKINRGYNSEDVFFERNKKFQQLIPDRAIKEADVVIGFDTSSWILVDRCKKLGTKFILDVSIAHPISKQNVYKQIAQTFPTWTFAIKNKPQHLIDIENYEMQNACKLVVASTFSKQTLIENNIAENKIAINPYGVNAKDFFPAIKQHKGVVNFVFVGIVDARKGVPLLLKVWKHINKQEATLTLIGPVDDLVQTIITEQAPSIVLKGKLMFDELMQTVSKYDVMVFPSYFEGFGLVILEAMASGLPVITTPATCGVDIIQHGIDGMIVQTGDENELLSAMQAFINLRVDKSLMAKKAREKAIAFSWDAYGTRWNNFLTNLINSKYESN